MRKKIREESMIDGTKIIYCMLFHGEILVKEHDSSVTQFTCTKCGHEYFEGSHKANNGEDLKD